jgi:hypothetical protein
LLGAVIFIVDSSEKLTERATPTAIYGQRVVFAFTKDWNERSLFVLFFHSQSSVWFDGWAGFCSAWVLMGLW